MRISVLTLAFGSLALCACDAESVAEDGSSTTEDASTANRDAGPESSPDGGPSRVGAWVPPPGIPMPELDPNDTVASACAGCTVRTQDNLEGLTDLPAGTVVEVRGGSFAPERELVISGNGTASQPIFVRGIDEGAGRPVIRGAGVRISGRYVVVEGFFFDFDRETHSASIRDADHVMLRDCEIANLHRVSNTTALVLLGSHIVVYDNEIHDNRNFDQGRDLVDFMGGELDIHGVGGDPTIAWVIGNHIHHNRGDGMQFGHRDANVLGDIYIGDNDIHHNGENSIDIKEASNVVVSGNRLYDNVGAPVVLHDCAINGSVIYNDIYRTLPEAAANGLSFPSLEAACDPLLPIDMFAIRNRFSDLSDRAMTIRGSGKRYFISGNTFTNVGTWLREDNPGGPGSIVEEGDAQIEAALAAWEAIYCVPTTDLPHLPAATVRPTPFECDGTTTWPATAGWP